MTRQKMEIEEAKRIQEERKGANKIGRGTKADVSRAVVWRAIEQTKEEDASSRKRQVKR